MKVTRYGEIKPWEKMRVTRQKYAEMRPWEGTGLTREEFERVVVELPEELFDAIYEDVEAELLVQKLFKIDRVD